MTEPAEARQLPRPTKHRWQPLRSGLTGIFKYDEEEFQFEDGRLLLRGNNGAGKSRVLAMQLPFLLDGELNPIRVEPDRDKAKKMEWNVLTNRYDNRLGYTWIEFGRRDNATGEEFFLTLGCGLHARKGMGIPPNSRWFFVTEQRIGRDFFLLNDNRIPLQREQLRAVLEAGGELFQTASDYRRAVDDALFGLGPRYGALIDLLIRLRQPQLMRELDMNWLSGILSEALPPLSPNLIGDVAAAFRGIDEDRQSLADYRSARENVADFLETYRHYARLTVRRQADVLRRKHSDYEQKGREILRLRERGTELTDTLDTLRAELTAARNQLDQKRAAEGTLRDSPEMKSAEELERALQTRNEKRTTATKAKEAREEAEESRQSASDAKERARETHESRLAEAEEALADFQKIAHGAEAPADIATDEEISDRGELESLRKRFSDFCDRRRSAITLLSKRNAELAGAAEKKKQAESELDREQETMRAAQDASREAEERQSTELDDLVEAIYEWENRISELNFEKGRDWRTDIEEWIVGDKAPVGFPLEIAVDAAQQSSGRALISQLEKAKAEKKEAGAELDTLDHELAELREGKQPEPPIPRTRAEDTRMGRAGVALWQACGFADHLSETERAGYEAALESSGLLDAWIEPDGTLLDQQRHDVVLTAAPWRENAEAAGLNHVLKIETEAVDPDVIWRILNQIGCDESGDIWVTADGRWRNGPAHGAWKKPEAEFLGYTARENNRHRRIAVLEEDREKLAAKLESLAEAISELESRLERLGEEVRNSPKKDAIWSVTERLKAAEAEVTRAQERVAKAEDRAGEMRGFHEKAERTRDRDADDSGLANWREPDALSRLRELMSELQAAANGLWPRWEAVFDAAKNLAEADTRLGEATQRFDNRNLDSREAESEKIEAESRYDTLFSTMGKSVEEVLARLESVEKEIVELNGQVKKLDANERSTETDLAVNRSNQETAEVTLGEKRDERDAAVEQLNTLVKHRIFEEADPDLQPGDEALKANPAVDLARRTEQCFTNLPVDEESLRRAENHFQGNFSTLNDQLNMRGYSPSLTTLDGGARKVTCIYQGTERTMREMHELLREEVEQREHLLSAKERAVIENHLLGEIASELQGRIRDGEDWKRNVNGELESRPTSSGIKLRFRWEPDAEGPAGLSEARSLLLKTTTAWSVAERDAIGKFLQERIHAEQAENEGGSWQEHLTAALDYRAWHRFEVERFQDGSWKKLTKRTYGTGSGGEKAVTLTLPQFAAAAAHYQSAADTAPRLILLDEVFVGIDAPTRAELMGLLKTFDLDFVMTSEREWGCYKTVPALAVYQLSSSPENPAVFVTRWVWNGRHRAKQETV